MADKKAIYIEIRWDDGSVSRATDDVADEIMRWYGACEAMNCVHGARYQGRHFDVITPAEAEMPQPDRSGYHKP